MTHGRYSLPAELCLLAWDPATGQLAGVPQLPGLVRAGALTELLQRGLLTDADGAARPDDDARTGDFALDDLLELIGESRPHSWRDWVTRHAKLTLDAVRGLLERDGALRPEHKRMLGLLPAKDYTLEREAAVTALRADALRLLRGPGGTAAVPGRDAALIALADAGELRTVVSGDDAVRYRQRIAGLAARSERAARGAAPEREHGGSGAVGGAGAPGTAGGSAVTGAQEAAGASGAAEERVPAGIPGTAEERAVAEVRAGLADAVAAARREALTGG
ncbi:GPP34 family phosphoprotein [Streptomyces sp. NPDC048845]|uniref:GOLPH3/VPS74 family protein n=1 Tax=Streptomyces sp. NPDC048845 TaxID=3155390 RepID=UPI00344636B0